MAVTRFRAVLGGVLATLVLASGAGGQEVVELPATDRRINANFEEVFRVGAMDGDAWETFGEIASTAFDAEGNLYIFDRQASRIVVVSPEGEFVREIGQAGEGPGEFRMAMNFAVMRDGRIVIVDMGHRSFQLFSPDGDFERMVGMGGGMVGIGGIEPQVDGRALITGGGGFMAMEGGPGATRAEPTTRPIDLLTIDGDVVGRESFVEAWLPPRGDPEELEGGGMRFSMTMAGPRTFEPRLLSGVLPDGGIAYTDSSAYAVKITTADGSVARVLYRPFEPIPVTPAIEDAEKARQLAQVNDESQPTGMRVMVQDGGGGGTRTIGDGQIRDMMRSRVEQLQFFTEVPVIRDLQTSWSGKIWVQRRGDEPETDGPLDVITPEGRYAGSFEAGTTVIPSAFGPNGLAAYLETDEFDVPTIVVRRLPPVIN